MWVPRNSEHIEQAACAGELPESPSFDAKADLPQPKQDATLAVDVAAMATDGGVLLYGVGQDENGRPTVPNPIELSGSGERIAQIVATSITEVPHSTCASTQRTLTRPRATSSWSCRSRRARRTK